MTNNNSNESDEYGELLKKAGSQATFGCAVWVLAGVGLVLALVGLGHAAAAVLKFMADDGHWWLHIGPGLLFLVAGGMVLHLARQLSKAPPSASDDDEEVDEDTLDKLRERQLSSGQVTGAGSMLKQVQVWAAILVMVVLGLIMTVVIITELADSTAARWIMAAAVLIALSFAHNASREARRARERGSSRLTIDNSPVHLGEQLTGSISIYLGPEPEQIRLMLICENRRTTRTMRSHGDIHSQEEKSTTVTPLHLSEQTVLASELEAEGNNRWLVPVSLDIPPDVTPTDHRDPDNCMVWRLKLVAHCADGETPQDGWEVQVLEAESSDERSNHRELTASDQQAMAIKIRHAENPSPFTEEQLEDALIASQRSDVLSITIRAITLLVVYALLARAILNGLTGASLLLPLVIELLAMLLVGWLVLRPLIDCRKFRKSMGGIVQNLIFLGLLLAAAYGLLKVDARIVLPDQITLTAVLEAVAPLREDTALLLAIVAAVTGLLASSLNEALHWRSRGGVFVWTSINFIASRLAVLLVLGFLSAFILLPAWGLEWLPDRNSPLVETIGTQQWAWPVWTILLILDAGALVMLAMMHRDAKKKLALQAGRSDSEEPHPAGQPEAAD
jgi:hypothetical protein